PPDHAEPEVLLDRELGEDASAFRDERNAGARDRLGLAADRRLPAQAYVAGPDADQAGEGVQRRRLPGAVRADQPDDLRLADTEREVPHGGDGTVVNPEAADVEDGRRRGRHAPAS